SLPEAEVVEVVRADFVAQERCEFLVLSHEGVLPVRAEDVMPVLDPFDRGEELAPEASSQPDAEDLADAVGGQAPEPHLASPLEDLVDGKVALENEIATVFDLGNGIEA